MASRSKQRTILKSRPIITNTNVLKSSVHTSSSLRSSRIKSPNKSIPKYKTKSSSPTSSSSICESLCYYRNEAIAIGICLWLCTIIIWILVYYKRNQSSPSVYSNISNIDNKHQSPLSYIKNDLA